MVWNNCTWFINVESGDLTCGCVFPLCCRSSVGLGFMSVAGGVFAAYLMALAVLSPCPPLLGSPAGVSLVVSHFNHHLLTTRPVSAIIVDLVPYNID